MGLGGDRPDLARLVQDLAAAGERPFRHIVGCRPGGNHGVEQRLRQLPAHERARAHVGFQIALSLKLFDSIHDGVAGDTQGRRQPSCGGQPCA